MHVRLCALWPTSKLVEQDYLQAARQASAKVEQAMAAAAEAMVEVMAKATATAAPKPWS